MLILDEATSALDYETQRKICNNLISKKKDQSIFFITHRLSTIRKADLIRRTQSDQNDQTLDVARLAQKDEVDKEKIEVSRERNAINIAKNMLGS